MFADDVVLCAREKVVLVLELGQWREESNESVKSKNGVGLHVPEWNAIRKC